MIHVLPYCPVLLFHATFPGGVPVPPRLDNCEPERIHDELARLKRHYAFLPIDELCARSSLRGVASVTFDDGYRSVIDQAWPVLKDLGIPITIFVNGASLEGVPFWRDQVRAVIAAGRESQLEALVSARIPEYAKLRGSLYSRSKSPAIHSRAFAEVLDAFCREHLNSVDPGHSIRSLAGVPSDPLLTFGNHTHHHYVLSSLRDEEQAEEIERTEDVLERAGVHRSRVLAIPFGGADSFNRATLRIARSLGFRGALLTRGRLNRYRPVEVEGIRLLDRFMPGATARRSVPWQIALLAMRDVVVRGLAPADLDERARN